MKNNIGMGVFTIQNYVSVPSRCMTYGEMYVMEQFQRHFMDLAVWSRALVLTLKYNLPNAEDIYKRLLAEPSDTREIIATFYGLENAQIYENYLTQLIINIRHLTDALITNNVSLANESYQNLIQIAVDLSQFFYELNPSTSLDQWHKLLHGYVDMLYREIYTIVSGNFAGDIELFDQIMDQSYLIADYIGKSILSVFHPAAPSPPSSAPPAVKQPPVSPPVASPLAATEPTL